MYEKLVQGDKIRSMEFSLIDGSTIRIPEEMPGRYLVLLFYRGEW